MIYILTIVLFFSNHEPVVAAKAFPDITACEITEGDALTAAQADPVVKGWHVVSECVKVDLATQE